MKHVNTFVWFVLAACACAGAKASELRGGSAMVRFRAFFSHLVVVLLKLNAIPTYLSSSRL